MCVCGGGGVLTLDGFMQDAKMRSKLFFFQTKVPEPGGSRMHLISWFYMSRRFLLGVNSRYLDHHHDCAPTAAVVL